MERRTFFHASLFRSVPPPAPLAPSAVSVSVASDVDADCIHPPLPALGDFIHSGYYFHISSRLADKLMCKSIKWYFSR